MEFILIEKVIPLDCTKEQAKCIKSLLTYFYRHLSEKTEIITLSIKMSHSR